MSRPLARPKRAGEEFARTHFNDLDGPSSSKKARFDVRNPSALAPDAAEEDAILDADEIGKRGQQAKRNAVNIDGYDSDSENEGFDARVEAKAKDAKAAKRATEEVENDMFADLEEDFNDGDDDEDRRAGGKKKKDVSFLDDDEIEGQEFNSRSGGHVSADFSLNGSGTANRKGKSRQLDDEVESSSESEVAEEQRAEIGDEVDEEVGAGGKKSHAPKLDAFNMKIEQEEGRFDDQGNYVRKAADPDAIHDTWLEGVSKKDMRRAKEAAEKRDEARRRRDIADDAVTTGDILKTLITHLEKGESVLEALARLGKSKDKRPRWQKRPRQHRNGGNGMDVDKEAEDQDATEQKRKEAVETITGAADQLLTRGQAEIYEAEREMLMRQYRRETGEEWVDLPVQQDEEDGDGDPKQWEYRWADSRDGGDIHGPYDGTMMLSWSEAGYFGEGVEFRRAGQGGEWSRVVDFV